MQYGSLLAFPRNSRRQILLRITQVKLENVPGAKFGYWTGWNIAKARDLDFELPIAVAHPQP